MSRSEPGVPPVRPALDELAAAITVVETSPGDTLEAEALRLEADARAAGAVALELRARLALADMWDRRGESARSAQAIQEVSRRATEHGLRPLQARSHRLLAWVHHELGDDAAFLDHAV